MIEEIIKSVNDQKRFGVRSKIVTQSLTDFEHHDFICDSAIKLAEKERAKRKVNFLPKQCYRRVFRKHMSNDDMRLAIAYLNKERLIKERRTLLDEAHYYS